MGKFKDIQISTYEQFVSDMSPLGKSTTIRDMLQSHITVSADINNSRTSVILEFNDEKLKTSEILFLSENDALKLASILLVRASELK
jgi:hypothetical protein